ncbi:anaerobic ribonucleoside-triphosphate reductase activating protein [Lachnoclostridium sp. An14]|uniref:anaerobic ribonucleoside-triphosphate reductase activating protein n=1 Tax=Lachnoclostridium sp. An14 TaxID=1965562 RepID=UPI000B3900D4|nr:anaerobic ribonucleoside-triphosphate reductase activating protein [Lachnoclostridium sp. An14]OUQ18709.1 anaerobic ribonucleoside-triphosphate reductase activating protein [Lachnoclostridium sp. An14]
MRYHNITKDDMLNGDGLRVVLWVAGCNHNCKDCHNPVTWDIRGGIPFDQAAKDELFAELEKPHVSGVTLSGGDPLHPDNREDIGALIDEISQKFPYKTIWLYTGYQWEAIRDLPYIKKVDVVVDGEFVAALKNTQLHWRGSSNQRVIDVQPSLLRGDVVLHCK